MISIDVMGSGVFVLEALCAGTMGYAIQRGATCTVAAVDEMITQRRAARLKAMLEAAMWVLGGLLLAPFLLTMPRMPSGYAMSFVTVAGGALLGLGAFVNRACVFGALARLGSGDWAYLITPIGFLAGCAAFQRADWMAAHRSAEASIVQMLPSEGMLLVGALLMVCLSLRLWQVLRHDMPAAARQLHAVWTPHVATLVIGVTFLLMFLLAGPWAYTDVLAELAATLKGGMSPMVLTRVGLMLALFGGAVLGGWASGRIRHVPVTRAGLLRCFAGGLLMGMGSALIPGGNDGLLLMGLPLLWPYAWLAFSTMVGVIALAITLRQRWPTVFGWA